ncbi:hypothetical protein OIU84_004371 [Salix udensis]|uniref:Uncharacterized protein n=1 Tax=Salix udensis TaxID=889485 RepID=A0AAD6P4B0_9ROSI|nr:hypothetical protein OIU84_004371 [Salix udensis]
MMLSFSFSLCLYLLPLYNTRRPILRRKRLNNHKRIARKLHKSSSRARLQLMLGGVAGVFLGST